MEHRQTNEVTPRGVKQRVLAQYDKLSDKHRRLADFFIASAADASLLSSVALGAKVGVSNATVIRFSQMLGYDGYVELKQDLLHDLKQELAPEERFKLAERSVARHLIDRVARQEADNINQTMSRIRSQQIEELADLICAARRVHVLGTGLSAVLAEMLSYLLFQVRVDAQTSAVDAVPFEEKILRMTSKDLIIAFSLPPFSTSTIAQLEMARAQSVPVIGITNRETAPIAFLTKHVLVVQTENVLYTNATGAMVVVLNALVTEIAFRHRKRLVEENDRQRTRLASLYR